MRITDKGQVTIPIDIRHQLGLMPGDEVEFVIEGDWVRLHRAPGAPRRGRRLIDHMLGSRADVELSTDEIMELTRSE